MIPYAKHLVEEDDVDAVVKVLRSDRITQGPTVERFEVAVAAICKAKHAVACSSGTSAIYLMLEAIDRDRIAIPALTFIATASAAHHSGCEIVVEDVDDETLIMRPSEHYGLVVDYAGYAPAWPNSTCAFDAAHSFGSRGLACGGEAVAFSFHPAKTITTGEGGAVVTNDDEIAQEVRRLRDHGRRENGLAIHPGWNFRMPEINAALGLSQASKTLRFLARRQAIAENYLRELAGTEAIRLPTAKDPHAWHLFVIRVPASRRDRFRAFLESAGVGTQIHYPLVYDHPAFRRLRPKGGCPNAERAAKEVVSIPINHAMTNDEVGTVVGSVKEAARMVL